MGYGNITLVSQWTRLLVITTGLVTLFLFGGLISRASSYLILVFDDFFRKIKLDMLTKGYISVIFWFSMIWVTIALMAIMFLVTTSLSMGVSMSRLLESVSYTDAYWFNYITMTTIGLGDFHIPSYSASTPAMFLLPLLQLFGFVVMSVFIEKITHAMRTSQSTTNSNEITVDQKDDENEKEITPLDQNCLSLEGNLLTGIPLNIEKDNSNGSEDNNKF